MPAYEFQSDQTPPALASAHLPEGLAEVPGLRQLSHAQGGRHPLDGTEFMAYQNHLEEFLIPGFRALDQAMQHYWSGIRVPTRDSYRLMRVKVAGGEKSLLIWHDDMKEGRARLPLAALDRTGHEFNPQKFSPRYHAMTSRFLSRRGNLAAKVYRPVPFLVNYTLLVWAEHKRDADYMLYQILTRFNPLAEFRMYDGHIAGAVQLRFGGSTDASEKEVGHDQHANIRYEITMTAEAWLPLPEQIVPTVLGQVKLLREKLGEILLASVGNAVTPGTNWIEPIQTPDAADIVIRTEE